MQKRVQRKEVTLTVGDSPSKKSNASGYSGSSPNRSFSLKVSGEDFPDPDELAERYGVLEKAADSPSRHASKTGLVSSPSSKRRDHDMLLKLEEKNRKIEQLCVLLEALEPTPGVDPEKIRRAMQEGSEAEGVDFRDGKIVALAKKSHRLTMQVNKEKAQSDKLNQQLLQLQQNYESVSQQLAVAKAQAGTGGQAGGGTKVYNRHALTAQQGEADAQDAQATISELQRDLKESNKATEELKRRVAQASEENKQLARALQRELGDGVSLDQAVSGGWRGRAQQIVMLKAKIKRMESESGTVRTGRSGGTNGKGNLGDVDTKAEEDLVLMSQERRQVVEALTQERVSLMEANRQLEKKGTAQRARIQNLEVELKKMKENLQVVISKSENDDQLLEALRREVQRLKGQLAAAHSNGGAGGSRATGGTSTLVGTRRGSVSAGGGRARRSASAEEVRMSTDSLLGGSGGGEDGGDLGTELNPSAAVLEEMEDEIKQQHTEILRLRRLCNNQSEQLDSQDVTIRELRKKLNKY